MEIWGRTLKREKTEVRSQLFLILVKFGTIGTEQ